MRPHFLAGGSCFYHKSDQKNPSGGGRWRNGNGGGRGRLKFLKGPKRTDMGIRGVDRGIWWQGKPPEAFEGTPRDPEGSVYRRLPGLPQVGWGCWGQGPRASRWDKPGWPDRVPGPRAHVPGVAPVLLWPTLVLSEGLGERALGSGTAEGTGAGSGDSLEDPSPTFRWRALEGRTVRRELQGHGFWKSKAST